VITIASLSGPKPACVFSKPLNYLLSPQRHRDHGGMINGMLEYWNIGPLGKSKDQRSKQSNHSKALLSGFSTIPSFQYSIIPTDFALLALYVCGESMHTGLETGRGPEP